MSKIKDSLINYKDVSTTNGNVVCQFVVNNFLSQIRHQKIQKKNGNRDAPDQSKTL